MHIKTGRPEFDDMIPVIRSFLEKDILDLEIDGRKIRGYRSPDARSVWIRDYSDMIRGFRHFEKDLKSTILHFAETQAANGRIYDYFTTYPEKLPCERENWTKYVRVPVEADVEYRLIKAAWIAWQATGDDEFIKELLPCFEKALGYIMNGWYWDKEKFLVKRPYTIDTWDFAYTAGKHDWLQFRIDENTFWGYMHGDNSGYFEAFSIMGRWYLFFGEKKKAFDWFERAEKIRNSMNRHCWNGNFYTHFVKITPCTIEGVDEGRQLSLSNPMNINRGVTSQAMAASIIREYIRRGSATDSFAEWFSIDPPFPDGIFGDAKLVGGAYCNGGIMPLVGGELARAAFANGFEEYGAEILRKYYSLISQRGETYLWYFPDGTHPTIETSTSPEAAPTDGWGSSAMLYALTEGLAGVSDTLKDFRSVKIIPSWESAGIADAEVLLEYPASGHYVKYVYNRTDDEICLRIEGSPRDAEISIKLPSGKKVVSSSIRGGEMKSAAGIEHDDKYFRCRIGKKSSPAELILKI